mmetsp:Transcript_39255/g.47185  ORF Transcript_39255/g.47185 Transcript_39255/m.47185 type:complete len:337 (+) Transcript_39255:25-1035(+)
MMNLKNLLSSSIFATSYLFSFVDAIENVGGAICNTKDDQVFVKELVQSVDATIFGFQDRIASGGERFMIGSTKNGIRRGFLKFLVDDEEDIFPSDAKVECTEIRLFVAQNDEERRTVPAPQIELHQVVSDWKTTGKNNLQLNGLNGGTANTGDTTWKYSSYPSIEWENKGGDFSQNVLAETIAAGDLHWYGKTRAMAEVVQGWINDASTNYGFILISSDEDRLVLPGSYSRYNGIESEPELIPRLIVTYTSPSQGKPDRIYNDYSPLTLGGSKTSNNSGNGAVLGLVFAGIGVALVAAIACIWIRSRNQGKEEISKSSPDATQQDDDAVQNDAEIL